MAQGGIIITNSGLIAAAIEKYYSDLKTPGLFETLKEFFEILLMTVFIHPALYWFSEGLPFLKLGETLFYKDFPMKRLSGMRGGYLRNWQKRLEKSNRVRSETAAYFTEQLGLKTLQKAYIPYLRLPVVMRSREIRDKIYSLSRKRGLGLSLMYPTAINEIKEIRTMFNGEVFPFAREIADKLLTIPTHHLLSEKDKRIICELFSSFRSEVVWHDSNIRSEQIA